MAIHFPTAEEMRERAKRAGYQRRQTGARQASAVAADLHIMAERQRDRAKKRPDSEGVYLRQIARVITDAAEVLEREAMLARDFNRDPQ